MDVDGLLQRRGVDVSRLDPAPPLPTWAEVRDRIALMPGCTLCGGICLTAWVIDMGSGPRWVDLCRGHTPGVLSEPATPMSPRERRGAARG